MHFAYDLLVASSGLVVLMFAPGGFLLILAGLPSAGAHDRAEHAACALLTSFGVSLALNTAVAVTFSLLGIAMTTTVANLVVEALIAELEQRNEVYGSPDMHSEEEARSVAERMAIRG